MSLERKDVRFKLTDENHVLLKLVTDASNKDIGDWVEELVVRELMRNFHAASLIVDGARRAGISGIAGEQGK